MTIPKFRVVNTSGRGLGTITFKKGKKDKTTSFGVIYLFSDPRPPLMSLAKYFSTLTQFPDQQAEVNTGSGGIFMCWVLDD